jgi:hypothetical protein
LLSANCVFFQLHTIRCHQYPPLSFYVRQKKDIIFNACNKYMSLIQMSQTLIWRDSFKYLALLGIPFLLGFLSHKIAEFFPGRFEVIHWQLFVSLAFLICGSATIFFIWRHKAYLIAKLGLSVLAATLFLSFAFLASVRSNCGHEPKHIGKPKIEKVSVSCG